MTSKERMTAAFDNKIPDRLPVTTHHLMPFYLNRSLGGISNAEFFERFGLDPIIWACAGKYTEAQNENWRITWEEIADPKYKTHRYYITTPGGVLTAVLQSNAYTTWCSEYVLKDKRDIDLLAKYMPGAYDDPAEINRIAAENPNTVIRGSIWSGDIHGQPGCWQQAACLFGIENLIMESYDDPEWVHELLEILLRRKLDYVRSLKGANYDILELGGGDASTTVISPGIFNEFAAPYDKRIVDAAHEAGQRIVYHTCGGMMPILEDIAAMGVDAMETFTPPDMGGDTDLAAAKRRIGDKVCMIGGFDQFHFFKGCTPEDTRREVRRCFEAAGANGGFILCPSDHFFEADTELIKAFADEAAKCVY